MNTGQILEALNDKADRDLLNTSPVINDYVIETQLPTSSNNYTWYRKYKSGWVEQGGLASYTSTTHTWSATINLPNPMADSNYFATAISLSDNPPQNGVAYRSQTTVNIYCTRDGGSAVTQYMLWEVKGQGV